MRHQHRFAMTRHSSLRQNEPPGSCAEALVVRSGAVRNTPDARSCSCARAGRCEPCAWRCVRSQPAWRVCCACAPRAAQLAQRVALMATLLEQTRLGHEESERLERLIVAELSREARSHRERLVQAQRVAVMVDRIADRAGKLVRAPPFLRPSARRAARISLGVRVGPPVRLLTRAPRFAFRATSGRSMTTRTALARRRLRRWGAARTSSGACMRAAQPALWSRWRALWLPGGLHCGF